MKCVETFISDPSKQLRSLPDALDHYLFNLQNQLKFASEQFSCIKDEQDAFDDYIRIMENSLDTLETLKNIINIRINIAKGERPLPF